MIESLPSWWEAAVSEQLHFDSFRIDLANERLWRGQRLVPLRPKSYALLLYLAQHANRLIPQMELTEALWHHPYLSESLLRGYIRELRRVLGDTAKTPRFIETASGRGYRFLPVVTRRESNADAARADAQPFASDDPSSLFVGREDELDWLLAEFQRAT